jgi:hypothetical protein
MGDTLPRGPSQLIFLRGCKRESGEWAVIRARAVENVQEIRLGFDNGPPVVDSAAQPINVVNSSGEASVNLTRLHPPWFF